MEKLLRFFLAMGCFAVLLCSCGGGGGGTNVSSPSSSSPQIDASIDEGQGGGNSTSMPYGAQVGEFLGVAAYSNGDTHAIHNNDYYDYGHHWQCVEYVNRFLCLAKGYKNLRGSGNAKAYWTADLGLQKLPNRGPECPIPGDVIISDYGETGHAAIVRDITSDSIHVIQQNWNNNYEDGSFTLAYSFDGNKCEVKPFSGGKYSVVGWLRVPNQLQATPVDTPPIAEAAVSTSLSGPYYGYDNSITVIKGQSVNLYFFADKDVNGDGKASLDLDGWSDQVNGVTLGGKVEWNTDLNQGTPSFEKIINNPSNAAAGNIGPLPFTFNDAPGTYEYQILRVTDRNGLQSNISKIRVKVVAPANSPPVAEAAVSFSTSGPFYGYDNPITVPKGQPVNLYFFADKDVNGDNKASLDPDGWQDPINGVSSGGKAEWNTNLNQGTPDFEKTINSPSSAGAANIGPFAFTFNDTPGTYEYQMLRVTDRNGVQSNISKIRVNVAEGYASISQGVTISANPALRGQNFKISFTLKETKGVSKTFDEVAIRVTDPSSDPNTNWFDFVKFSAVTVPANGTTPLEATNYIYASRPAGTYVAEVWGKIGDKWFSFDTVGASGVNPKFFTVK